MFKLDLEKAENQRSNYPTSVGSSKKQVSEKHLFVLYWLHKAFDCVDHKKVWKILKETGIPDHLTCLREICMQVKKTQLEPDMGQQTASKLGKDYIKVVYHHPAYLTSMQNISCKMLGWMKHQLESRLPWEISITSDTQMTPPLWQKVKKSQEPPDEIERREWKSWLKAQYSENYNHGIWSHHFMANRWRSNENTDRL